MKKQFLSFLTLTVFMSINAQMRLPEQFHKTEEKNYMLFMQNNSTNDTLWICDSVIHYTVEGEKYGKYEVLGRNDLGNEVSSKFDMKFIPVGISGYSYFDSTTYFSDNKTVENKSRSVYIGSSDSWERSYFKQYEYPAIDKEEIYKFYIPASEEFNGGFWKHYSNRNGRCDTLYNLWLVNDNTWENRYIIKYFYDNEGNDTLHLHQYWKNNNWEDSIRYKRIFNMGNLIDSYEYRMDKESSNWENYTHLQFTYNSSGLNDTAFQENWISTENEWRDIALSIYTYDDNGRYIVTLSQSYSDISQQLENYILITDNYDNNNHTIIYKYWVDNEWVNDSKRFYSYLDANKSDTIMSLNWDTSLGDWVPKSRSFTTFDSQENANEYFNQDYKNNEWQTINYFHYFWSAFVPSLIGSNSISEIKVFPNPVNGAVKFKSENSNQKTIFLYSLSGKLILIEKFDSKEYLLDCSTLTSGLYIYRVFQGGIGVDGKLIIR